MRTSRASIRYFVPAAAAVVVLLVGAWVGGAAPARGERSPDEQVARGRLLVLHHGCGDCHGGGNPAAKGWLAGATSPMQEFRIGPCFADPNAKPVPVKIAGVLLPRVETKD